MSAKSISSGAGTNSSRCAWRLSIGQAPLFCLPAPAGWITGNFDFLDYQRPIELLRKGIIDAWVASYPDIPDKDDDEVGSILLNRMPMYLVVSEGHPLLQLGDAMTMADVAEYPSLPLPEGAFPKFQAIASACGIWNNEAKLTRFNREYWYGRMDDDDLLVGYATPLTFGFLQKTKVILPVRLPITVGDALLVRRPFLEAPRPGNCSRRCCNAYDPWWNAIQS